MAQSLLRGVRQPQPMLIGDHHEQRVAALQHRSSDVLQRPIGELIGEALSRNERALRILGNPCPYLRHGRHRSRDRQRPLAVLGGKPPIAHRGEHRERQTQCQKNHGDLQKKHLRAQSQHGALPGTHVPEPRQAVRRMRKTDEIHDLRG